MKQSAQAPSDESGANPVPFMATTYVAAMRDASQRLEGMQRASRTLQATFQQESVNQMRAMVEAMTRLSRALDAAGRDGGVAGLTRVQPELMDCMLDVSRNGNESLVRMADAVRACTAELGATTESAATDTQPEASETGQAKDSPDSADGSKASA